MSIFKSRKNMFKSKRARIRAFSYLFTAFIVALVFGTYGYILSYRIRTELEYSYQRNLSDLGQYVNNIDTSLVKTTYAGTPLQTVGLSTKIFRDSANAKSSMSQLPFSDTRLDNTNKFLSQVGDYAYTISQSVLANKSITDEQRQNLIQLSDYAKKLSSDISDILTDIQSGRLRIGEVQDVVAKNIKNNPNASELDSFQKIENSFTNYPTLIYDGPYSDHISKLNPEYLKDRIDITENDAKVIAAKFLNIPQSKLSFSGQGQGTITSYNYSYNDIYIEISKKGGQVIMYLDGRKMEAPKYDQTTAIKKAEDFLKNLGMTSMKESYFLNANGVVTVNFAYVQNNVICYTDLIKVNVALDKGNVISYEATGFLMNHKTRTIPAPTLTVAQAQSNVSKFLKINSNRLVIIPDEAKNEKYCYEFNCTGEKGEPLLVYINATNGVEEQILLLLSTPGGTLTM
jgi:spore germination protein